MTKIRRAKVPEEFRQGNIKSNDLFRIDMLANRIGYNRLTKAIHCVTEPGRSQNEEDSHIYQTRRLLLRNCFSKGKAQTITMNKVQAVEAANMEHLFRGNKETWTESADGLNEFQRVAIGAAAESTASLIQGPPGNGKTSTCIQLLTNMCRMADRNGVETLHTCDQRFQHSG